ncbi:MAG: 16S rRNA (adenine(1518)-N(6)/adenine(1519)-N(6))-dimethyltransferase RsmA [Candidatus Nanopelagicaceae bacterium]|jgi:16S rRNA (adenine1518-N6/adenine1519-N6)-dimethyltransferase
MSLLGAAEIRELAVKLDLNPSKGLGQNFVIDGNTCQRIVRQVEISKDDVVLEIGPGLGSLSLAILETGAPLIAVEIDNRLAKQLPETVALHNSVADLTVINKDALEVTELPKNPTVLVANLPYNVSVPVLLNLLERFPSLREGVVMVQAEVADRLAAKPGNKDYGVPSLKGAWWADLNLAGNIARSVFWPIPNVDSKLVYFKRHEPLGSEEFRNRVFALIDAAFSQRRKMIRSAMSSVLGVNAETIIAAAGIDPTLRGEALDISAYTAIASQNY